MAEELADARLVRVLATFTPDSPGLSQYFPKSLQELGLLRAFITHFCAVEGGAG